MLTEPLATIDYVLLETVPEVEHFLKSHFLTSHSKLKKNFDRAFLNRSLPRRSTLKLPLNFVNDGMINPSYEGPLIKIISEDENFLVMDKPSNLFVHPLSYDEKNNCLSFLRNFRPLVLNINQKNYDRGLLYRLDFETSGVLVYVKNQAALSFLRQNFKSLMIKKSYLCWVEGECTLAQTYTHYFSKKEQLGKRVTVFEDPLKGVKGELSIRPLEYQQKMGMTLLEVELKTGLRHQIRAQLAHLGFPLRGDVFYGGNKAKRLYLHAFNYQFTYLQKSYSFKALAVDFNGL